ncbi:hypothetical protein ALC60_04241 [Trachymyrmex zeteki]|uniref:Uncharacterized protein n=1 Tax=Mycetomoellerius zeteki TaxID=64791 RepID=A0A151X8F2_9HYME|nr:hypothetical protein ALC60_04241 [Trachymyrmex zeteki]
MNDQEIYGLGESAGVNRFEDKSLAGNVRIVPPTPVAHKTSVEMNKRSLQSRKAMMQQMDELVRFIRLVRSKKRDKTNTDFSRVEDTANITVFNSIETRSFSLSDMTETTFPETFVATLTCQKYPRVYRENFNSPYNNIALSNDQGTITGHRPAGLKVIFRSGCLVGGTKPMKVFSPDQEKRKNEGRTGKEKEEEEEEEETDVEAKGQRSSISVKEI